MGDPADHAFVVADGILSAQCDEDGRPRIEGYFTRGDVFGDDDLEPGGARALSVVAAGPARLVALPRDAFLSLRRRHGTKGEDQRRVTRLPVVPSPRGALTTSHVLKDVYRMRAARSLLVIDQDSCTRCGQCAYACAEVHHDGVSRLVRRGEKVTSSGASAPLLVPSSCQHCKNPACMIDCPTGAIGRTAGGDVFIREDLCTGCGACAKACPWDNIQIARRSSPLAAFTDVAVKCDLCAGSAAGPACVSACPAEALARIDPNEALPEVVALARTRLGNGSSKASASASASLLPRRFDARPWLLFALTSSVGASLLLARAPRAVSGMAAAALVGALVAHSALKRAPRLIARLSAGRPGLARVLYVVHACVGAWALAATAAHAGTLAARTAGGALALAIVLAAVTGAFGAFVNVVVPRRLTRIERRVLLPEELDAHAGTLDEGIYAKLSGKSELVKVLFARDLRPYWRARGGGLWLVLTGRTLREEEGILRRRIDALLEGRGKDRVGGIDELVRLVVERRALDAQVLLTRVLRGWLPVHVTATGAAVALLVAHVLGVVGVALRSGP